MADTHYKGVQETSGGVVEGRAGCPDGFGMSSSIPGRYKSLCPDTWPHWHGPPGEGVERLIKYIGYQPQDYKLGK